MIRALLPAMVLLLPVSAGAGELRRITVDGALTLEAEILETTGAGFRVQVPSGILFIPFEQVTDLAVIDHASAMPPWSVVLVGAEELRSVAAAAYEARAGLDVLALEELPVDDALRASLTSCGSSAGCLATLRPADAWWFFVVVDTVDGQSRVHGRPPFASADISIDLDAEDAALTWSAFGEVLGLARETATPSAWLEAWPPHRLALLKLARPVRPERARSANPGLAWSFIPLPGLPSLVRRDYAGFAGALAATAGLTAAWVGASGSLTTSKSEFVGVSVAGAYASSVASSQAFAALPAKRPGVALSVVPVVHGVDRDDPLRVDGAALSLSWSR